MRSFIHLRDGRPLGARCRFGHNCDAISYLLFVGFFGPHPAAVW